MRECGRVRRGDATWGLWAVGGVVVPTWTARVGAVILGGETSAWVGAHDEGRRPSARVVALAVAGTNRAHAGGGQGVTLVTPSMACLTACC